MVNRVLVSPLLFAILLQGCDWQSHDKPSVPGPNTQVLSDAKAGNQAAQARLGWMYHSGQGTPQDDTQAVYWYGKAADQGNALAQLAVGISYASGRGVTQDYEQAANFFRKSAAQGNVSAQFDLGEAYYNGQGVPKDYAEAVLWYRKAADQGNDAAEDNLGFAYAIGQGAPQDDAQAMLWYKKAVERNNPYAEYDLSTIYDESKDVPEDYAESYFGKRLDWTAIKRTHPTRRDYSEAYFWVDIALAGTLEPKTRKAAEAMRESVERRLTNDQLLAIQARATLWFEQHNPATPSR
jgi:TPR repeat protein